MPATKKYKFGTDLAKETVKLKYEFRHASSSVQALGMVLGKDTPAISRKMDTAYQMISTRSGLLMNVTLTNSDIKHFEDALEGVCSDIAVYNANAAAIKEIKTLKKKVTAFIKANGKDELTEKEKTPAPLVAPPSDTTVDLPLGGKKAPIYGARIGGKTYVSLDDLIAALTSAKEHYEEQAKNGGK